MRLFHAVIVFFFHFFFERAMSLHLGRAVVEAGYHVHTRTVRTGKSDVESTCISRSLFNGTCQG